MSRLKSGPAASLTLNFLVTLFEKTFAFAILASHFWLASILLHVLSKSNAVGWPTQTTALAAPLIKLSFLLLCIDRVPVIPISLRNRFLALAPTVT
jgi:hypothetical protein